MVGLLQEASLCCRLLYVVSSEAVEFGLVDAVGENEVVDDEASYIEQQPLEIASEVAVVAAAADDEVVASDGFAVAPRPLKTMTKAATTGQVRMAPAASAMPGLSCCLRCCCFDSSFDQCRLLPLPFSRPCLRHFRLTLLIQTEGSNYQLTHTQSNDHQIISYRLVGACLLVDRAFLQFSLLQQEIVKTILMARG